MNFHLFFITTFASFIFFCFSSVFVVVAAVTTKKMKFYKCTTHKKTQLQHKISKQVVKGFENDLTTCNARKLKAIHFVTIN